MASGSITQNVTGNTTNVKNTGKEQGKGAHISIGGGGANKSVPTGSSGAQRPLHGNSADALTKHTERTTGAQDRTRVVKGTATSKSNTCGQKRIGVTRDSSVAAAEAAGLSALSAEEDGPLYPQIASLYPIEVGDRPVLLETDGGAVALGRRAREGDEVVDDLINRDGKRPFRKKQELAADAQPVQSDPKNTVADTGYADSRADAAESAAKAASANKDHTHGIGDLPNNVVTSSQLDNYAKTSDLNDYAKKSHTHDAGDLPSGIIYASEVKQDQDGYLIWTG